MTIKYSELRKHLENAGPTDVTLDFDRIDQLVDGLPPSAYRYAAWWANDRTHVQAKAWLDAGRYTFELDFVKKAVSFSKLNRS